MLMAVFVAAVFASCYANLGILAGLFVFSVSLPLVVLATILFRVIIEQLWHP